MQFCKSEYSTKDSLTRPHDLPITWLQTPKFRDANFKFYFIFHGYGYYEWPLTHRTGSRRKPVSSWAHNRKSEARFLKLNLFWKDSPHHGNRKNTTAALGAKPCRNDQCCLYKKGKIVRKESKVAAEPYLSLNELRFMINQLQMTKDETVQLWSHQKHFRSLFFSLVQNFRCFWIDSPCWWSQNSLRIYWFFWHHAAGMWRNFIRRFAL